MIRHSLDGAWRLGWFDGRRGDRAFVGLPPAEQNSWLQATVPGEIHRDLERQGVIQPIEPGLGALAVRWMEDCLWYLERHFDVDALHPGTRAELVFDRLELDAVVYVNGTVVARHRNAFRPLRVDVTQHLHTGANSIRVELDGGLQAVRDLPARGYRHKLEQGLTKRHWLRTGQSQFSWDWSPRLVTVGITAPVALELREQPVRIEELVPIVAVSADRSRATLTCRVHLSSTREARARVTGRVLGIESSVLVTVAEGESTVEVELVVPDPPLWWPVGMGEQRLIDVVVDVDVDGAAAESRSRTIGLRTVEVDQSPTPDGGTLFRIVVNGLPFFAKGANWVPLSLTPNPVDIALLDRQLDRAIEANFNFLRVWGGGDYETEEFYAGCDSRGILVWQDFIFACSRYPLSDADFAAEATLEARHQVRRLAAHPSLAIWAGNNEIAWIGLSPGWPGPLVLAEEGVTHEEMVADHAFFEDDLRRLVADEDGTRFYQPSSPWSDDSEDNNDPHRGDQHPWQVGFDEVDFLLYRGMDARFPNEGGLLGSSSMPALLASLPEGQRQYDSFAWKIHENEVAVSYANRPLDALVRQWTGVRLENATLAEYAYWSGLVQGEALTEYIDNFRRRSDTTGAAVFWMYNDCWPTVRSWSIVDWQGGRSPAFGAVRRAFEPVRVVVVADPDGAAVYASNDSVEPRALELEWGTATLAGAVSTQRRPVLLPPLGSVLLERLPATDDPGTALVALLWDATTEVSRNRLFARPFAELPWAPAEIEMTHSAGSTTFTSKTFVLGVCLDLDGERELSDNFFDLYPGVPHTVTWEGEPPTVLFTGNSAGS